ncbi:ferredoxin [Nocardioides humi]|uniref:ferredoxin n=1 Tax=Nocardioides humi TaxID=449461 RepID=UPI00112A8A3F|nr:ferredoxin [Nocardioides humi]
MTSTRITVVPDRCIGAGNCVDVAPGHFAQDAATGLVVQLREEVVPEELGAVQMAVDVCPVMAIELTATDTA